MRTIINKYHQKSCEDFMINELINKNRKVDLVLSSPPYNIERGYDVYVDNKSKEEYLEDTIRRFKLFDKCLADDRVVLWNISYAIDEPSLPDWVTVEVERNTEFKKVDTIVWNKDNCTPLSTTNRLDRIFEYVYVFARKSEMETFHINRHITSVDPSGLIRRSPIRNMISCSNGNSIKGNKATFSVAFVKHLIDIYGIKGDVIYDPFMGSGTTGIAGFLSNCSFIGSEISEKQVEYSNKRLLPVARPKKIRFLLDHIKRIESSDQNNNGIQNRIVSCTNSESDLQIERIKELLSEGHTITSIRKTVHSEFNLKYSYQKIYSIKTLRCHKKIRNDLNEKIVSFLPRLSPEQENTAKKVKEIISEGFDRDYICEVFGISMYKYYQIHGLQGRYLIVGRHYNTRIKSKKKISRSKVIQIKRQYVDESGIITSRSLSRKFNLTEREIMNILEGKKHRNFGKEFNEEVFRFWNKKKSELKEKKSKKKLQSKIINSKTPSNKIGILESQSAA